LVVVVERDERHRDAVRREQVRRAAGVLAGHEGGGAQAVEYPRCPVDEVAHRRRAHNQPAARPVAHRVRGSSAAPSMPASGPRRAETTGVLAIGGTASLASTWRAASRIQSRATIPKPPPMTKISGSKACAS